MTHHLLGHIFGTIPKEYWEQKASVTSKFLLALKDTFCFPGYPGPYLCGTSENVRITEGWVVVLTLQLGMKTAGSC